jgi:thiol-disulfide isomerase/thioredoxin
MKIIKIGAMWCPACIVTNKYWNQIIEKYNEIEFINYDIDIDEEKVKELNIGDTLPEIIIYDENNIVKRIVGEKKKEEIEREIEEVLNEKK